jgi:hypothetical protein
VVGCGGGVRAAGAGGGGRRWRRPGPVHPTCRLGTATSQAATVACLLTLGTWPEDCLYVSRAVENYQKQMF